MLFLKFDFRNKRWEKQLIKNQPFSLATCSKIFNDVKKDNLNEYCAYRFCILVQIFNLFYEEDAEKRFKLFFWIRDEKVIKDFGKQVSYYSKNNFVIKSDVEE
jgi:hypothetical protein